MPDEIAPFGLLKTKYGSLIINRNDYHLIDGTTKGYGVGFQLMNTGEYDKEELENSLDLLQSRVTNFGPGVVVVDCGANIGVFTTQWAKFLKDVGSVYAFEAQEKIFYALAGNVILHNCLNVHARHAAVGAAVGILGIPEPDYSKPASFGSFELVKRPKTEDIGQAIDYSNPTLAVPLITIDSLTLSRLDFLKVDVEGMEMDVLRGAKETVARCQPQVFIEVYKSDGEEIAAFLKPLGYNRRYTLGLNWLFLHDSDPLKVEVALPPVTA